MTLIGQYWDCFPEKKAPMRLYHHTGPANAMYGMREGLAILAEEGLGKCIERHRRCAERLHQGKCGEAEIVKQ